MYLQDLSKVTSTVLVANREAGSLSQVLDPSCEVKTKRISHIKNSWCRANCFGLKINLSHPDLSGRNQLINALLGSINSSKEHTLVMYHKTVLISM